MTNRPVLDYVPRLIAANKDYRVEPAPVDLSKKSRWWIPSRLVLDQFAEGACVGGGVVHEYGASPHRGKIYNDLMFEVYNRAKEIDEWEGVNYSGTSVRAGMLVGRERGWWEGFKWAFNMQELRVALESGPIIIGVEWRDGMYEAPGGILTPTGPVVGGHCLLVTGYAPNYRRRGPTYRLRNSWSNSYGSNGNCYISSDNLNSVLFAAGGEASVPINRRA